VSTALYGVAISKRTSYGAPLRVDDLVPGGRDQSATFGYDNAARLVDAAVGDSAATRWRFRFRYDGLQNMIARFQEAPPNTPPSAIGVISGYYRHGGPGYGPRQISSIIHKDCPNDLSTFAYDKAGRVTRQDNEILTYDAFDQLTKVEKPAGTNVVQHGYGYDGLRTATVGGGLTQLWFMPDYTLHGSERWHYINIKERLVAKLVFPNAVTTLVPGGGLASAATLWMDRAFASVAPKVPALLGCTVLAFGTVLLVVYVPKRRRRGQAVVAVVTAGGVALLQIGCAAPVSRLQSGVEVPNSRTYFHQGLAAGPALITRQDGTIDEERRFEPFGEPLDGDLKNKDPHNSLNKERDPQTGWSYHGARWFAPQLAFWLTPDPAVKVFGSSSMGSPWSLNPYHYVDQSPTLFWDPDGEAKKDGNEVCWEPAYDPDRVFHVDLTKLPDLPDDYCAGPLCSPENVQAFLQTGRDIAFSPIAGPLWENARVYTHDPVRLAGASGMGATLWGGPAAQADARNSKSNEIINKDILNPAPLQPYSRLGHYGRTPTKADRKSLGAKPDEVVDHDPPLSKRFFEGDPKTGEKPGRFMTPEERAASANDRSRMKLQPKTDSNKQGRQQQEYTKKKNQEHDLK
jgi:RHS repeat-associated protein